MSESNHPQEAMGPLVISQADEERLRAIEGRSSWASEYEAEVFDDADMPERATAARQEATGLWDEADRIAQRYGFTDAQGMYDHIDEHGVEISAHLSETPVPDAGPPRQLSSRDEPREKAAQELTTGQRWERVQHRPSRAEQLDMAVIAPAVAAAAITR
jgi:hypothetical protein